MRRVEIVIRLYWGLLVLFGTVSVYVQISMFYQFHPDRIGPYNIPFASAELAALGYVLVPFMVAVLSATAAFWRRPLAYAGVLFFHLVALLAPLLALLSRAPKPQALMVENWLNVGLMAGILCLLMPPAVRAYFSLANVRKVVLYRYTALASFLYAALSFQS